MGQRLPNKDENDERRGLIEEVKPLGKRYRAGPSRWAFDNLDFPKARMRLLIKMALEIDWTDPDEEMDA